MTADWVVDSEIDVVRVYRNGANGFLRPDELRRDTGDTLTTTLLPGLTIPLDVIFSDRRPKVRVRCAVHLAHATRANQARDFI
jgi:hypothetical protein